MARGSFCVLDNDDLKFLLNQFPQVSFNTNIYQHSEQNDFVDVALTQLLSRGRYFAVHRPYED
jgi:hypothetical protein